MYRIRILSAGTPVDERRAETFAKCKSVLRFLVAKWPGWCVEVTNSDWAEGDDGLTQGERDEVEEVIGEVCELKKAG